MRCNSRSHCDIDLDVLTLAQHRFALWNAPILSKLRVSLVYLLHWHRSDASHTSAS